MFSLPSMQLKIVLLCAVHKFYKRKLEKQAKLDKRHICSAILRLCQNLDLGSQLTQFPFYKSSTTLLLFFKISLNFAPILENLEIENLHNGCIGTGVERDVIHLKFKLLHIYRSYVIHLNFNLNCYTFIDQMSFI